MASNAQANARFDPHAAAALEALRAAIDEHLTQLLALPLNERDLVAAARRDGVLSPGKRVRLLLMLLVGCSLGSET